MAATPRSELGATSPQTLPAALDYGRFDAIAQFAEIAASYWRSIAEAAFRGERLTLSVHCRQVAAVTRETFALVKTLGSGETGGGA
jgi:hypothetical protein